MNHKFKFHLSFDNIVLKPMLDMDRESSKKYSPLEVILVSL